MREPSTDVRTKCLVEHDVASITDATATIFIKYLFISNAKITNNFEFGITNYKLVALREMMSY